MAYTNPTITDFQAYFNRDFPYGNADLTTVQDVDINKGLISQQNIINPALFINQALYTQGALLLAAHFLVLNLRASSQGIAGKFNWLDQSKSVGGVNNAFAIPPRLLENPEFSWLCSTTYGTQFLMLILPYLTGNMFIVQGATIGPVAGIFSGPYGSVGPWNSNQIP